MNDCEKNHCYVRSKKIHTDEEGDDYETKMQKYLVNCFKRKTETRTPTIITFALKDDIGVLARTLKLFEDKRISLTHVESRPSKRAPGNYEFQVSSLAPSTELTACLDGLNGTLVYHQVLAKSENPVPWFPTHIKDLDEFTAQIQKPGGELETNHPGYNDQEFCARRKYISDIASNYRHGDPIPRVEYTASEIDTWRSIFNKVTALFETHACQEYNDVFPLLKENCGYHAENIPQLEDVSNFLKKRTGFSLRPVAGLMPSRDFLAGLAFRVFHSTQYVRHPSRVDHSEEPDVCHELLGHVPLFADPKFAQFSQEIGLLSLGASDECIKKLSTCYWFTVEVGLCRQRGETRAYGAAILSSCGELKYCLTDEPEVRIFDPEKACEVSYPVCRYQPVYFLAESFEDAKAKLRSWARKYVERPFTVQYNAYTQSVEVLDQKTSLKDMVTDMRGQLGIMAEALEKA